MATSTYAFLILVGVCAQTVTATTCIWYNSLGYKHTLYCPYSDCCGPLYNRYCCNYTPVGRIVGGVIGGVIFIGFCIALVACCTCACCPYHRYRTRGRVITTTTVPNYGTTVTVPVSGRPGQPYTATATVKPPQYQQAPPQYQ